MPVVAALLGLRGRCFWIFAFASMVDTTRAYHQARGVSDDISWATLADLGQQLVVHRNRRGTTGLDLQWWLAAHFLGALYALGRLQFHLYHLRCGIAGPAFWPESDEPGFRTGDATLGVHIPATGPLTPVACDESFAAATSFVRDHFPEHDFRVATCTSWLLDEQLADYLPADSNIVQFQRRFRSSTGQATTGATRCCSCSTAFPSRSTICPSARRSSGRSCSTCAAAAAGARGPAGSSHRGDRGRQSRARAACSRAISSSVVT